MRRELKLWCAKVGNKTRYVVESDIVRAHARFHIDNNIKSGLVPVEKFTLAREQEKMIKRYYPEDKVGIMYGGQEYICNVRRGKKGKRYFSTGKIYRGV